MIIVDTSGLLCLLDAGEVEHALVCACVAEEPGPLVTVDFVLAETDYLVLRRLGRQAEQNFLAQVMQGAVLREAVSDDDLDRASRIIEQFGDQDLGLTDAAVMAVSERLDTLRVLTLDRRHFTPFRDRKGRALELLPDWP